MMGARLDRDAWLWTDSFAHSLVHTFEKAFAIRLTPRCNKTGFTVRAPDCRIIPWRFFRRWWRRGNIWASGIIDHDDEGKFRGAVGKSGAFGVKEYFFSAIEIGCGRRMSPSNRSVIGKYAAVGGREHGWWGIARSPISTCVSGGIATRYSFPMEHMDTGA